MARQKILGLFILVLGGALGFVIREPVGLALVAVFLVAGLGVFFSSEARGLIAPGGSRKPRVLVLLKEIHARPQKGGKFREIVDPAEAGLELEVFVNCWFLNESDFVVQLVGDVQFSVITRGGARKVAERVPSDLNQWRLGSLVSDEWDTDVVRARQEPMPELSISDPLACGIPRHGWMHFRLRETSPAEFRNGILQLTVNDSSGDAHQGAGKSRFLPGRVWPAASQSRAIGEEPSPPPTNEKVVPEKAAGFTNQGGAS